MDLSAPALAGLLALPIVLIGLGIIALRRWSAWRERRELERIGRRLAFDESGPRPESLQIDADCLAQLYRLTARAELKVAAFVARRRHGEVDLEEKQNSAIRALRQIVAFAATQTSLAVPETRDADLATLVDLCEELFVLSSPRVDSSDRAGLVVQSRTWDRLAEALQRLRERLKQEFNAGDEDVGALFEDAAPGRAVRDGRDQTMAGPHGEQ